jgi:hypothetical protein
MRLMSLARLFAASIALTFASAVFAATPVVSETGQLIGATGVNVQGTLYDVTFQDGSCISLFGGCTQENFMPVDVGGDAAVALLNQVFLDSESGNFDSDPSLTRGCGPNVWSLCRPYVPIFKFTDQERITQFFAATVVNGPGDNDYFEGGFMSDDWDFTPDPGITFALFTPAAVSEPATWAMMLLGFGAIGVSLRSARRSTNALNLSRSDLR